VIQVDAEAAREFARRSAREGHAGGHLQRRHAGRHRRQTARAAGRCRVLGFNYDTGERYLSVEGFLPT
jgi:cysteine synthase A